jgi:hypothetical protein
LPKVAGLTDADQRHKKDADVRQAREARAGDDLMDDRGQEDPDRYEGQGHGKVMK